MTLVIVERRGSAAVVSLNHPPVNCLAHPVRLALWHALEAADADPGVGAIVLAGTHRGFCAGGDLREMRSPAQQAWPGISNHLLPRIEACVKPVIAAMHGFAIGGGLELALACHHRVADRATRIALPEIKHGVLPPSGSQRLPRALGMERALGLMLSGVTVPASDLDERALFDRLCDGEVVESALELAAQLDASDAPSRSLLRHRPLHAPSARAAIAVWRERLKAMTGASHAMHRCVDAAECAVNADTFDAGIVAAKRLHDDLARLSAAAR